MYFSAENLPGVNPVVMNYKIRYIKHQPARYNLAWPDCFFFFCGGRKTGNHGLYMRGYVRMCKGSHGGKLTQCVHELVRALVNCGRSMNIAAFSTPGVARTRYVAYLV